MATPNKPNTQRVTLPFTKEHGALTATETDKIFKARKRTKIERVDYINPTGLAADGTNAFSLDVKNGSTVVASVFNTDSGDTGGAALAANTFLTATNGSATARTLAADDILTLVFTEDGTATLPAGTVVIWFTELN